MKNINSIILKSFDLFSLIFVVFFGLVLFGFVVFADTASTSVSVGNAAPTVSSLSLNGGSDITLTEGSYKWASSTMTVSDSNGCSTITAVTAKIYYTAEANSGTVCTQDDQSCYISICSATTTGNTCDGGSDTSAQYDCGFKIWYNANPSDGVSQIWSVSATSTDGTDTGNATNTAETIEINTLNALNLSGNITYPATSANSNTGATNQTITITNTGNIIIDGEFSGDNMCTDYPTCSGDSFSVTNQKFDTSDVTYASLTNSLSGTPASVQLNIVKATATTSPSTQATYWGIAIPDGQATGSYTGQNTVSAITNF